MQSFIREMSVLFTNRPPSNTRYWLFAYFVLLVGLSTIGRSFNTGDMEFAPRLLLWSIVFGLIITQSLLLWNALRFMLTRQWLAIALSLLIQPLLLAAELDWLKHTPILPKQHDPYWEFVLFLLAPSILVGSGALLIVFWCNSTKRDSNTEDIEPNETILTIQAQEHYLLVTTVNGQSLEKGHIKDRVAKLDRNLGLQVHRSWWVAKEAVLKIHRQGRDYLILLQNGKTVPVGRSRVATLRKYGWL